MRLGQYEFAIERAEFCYIDRGLEPVAWDLNVYGHCANDDTGRPAFPTGLMLSAVGVPLPLSPTGDYTGFALRTPRAAYPDSGRSYFAVWAGEEYETWDVDLRITERRGSAYRLLFEAVTSFSGPGGYERLRVAAWAKSLSPRLAPKADYAMWLRPGVWGVTEPLDGVQGQEENPPPQASS
jgi:hypothetical protein